MTEVERLAEEQFITFRHRLCEILSEVEEEYKSAFMQGYAKGETDERFRDQIIPSDNVELEKKYESCLKENTGLKIHNTYLEKKLSKAKELFNDVLLMAKVEHLKGRYETVDEVEEFLKEKQKNS